MFLRIDFTLSHCNLFFFDFISRSSVQFHFISFLNKLCVCLCLCVKVSMCVSVCRTGTIGRIVEPPELLELLELVEL